MKKVFVLLTGFFFLFLFPGFAQEATPFAWKAESRKLDNNRFELVFSTEGSTAWQLYAPDQVLLEVPTTELRFEDSSYITESNFRDSGNKVEQQSPIFEVPVRFFRGPASFSIILTIPGKIPARLSGELLYTYGNDEEFHPSTSFSFTVALEGGIESAFEIKRKELDVKNPVNNCGDDDTSDKSLLTIFLLGFLGGLIALITPCVFPLIPLTVSFFTKKSGTRKRGIRNALFYGLSIFLIYALLSTPFHLLDKINPEVLNNISTNVYLNIAFFLIFIFFALSFFGLFELGLPPGLASKIDSRSGIGDFGGIFFMALTLAIVSFSCTGPILGSLLAGVLTSDNGAMQLTTGMSGFGLGLALPFALFALFPQWLQSLPKSGGWLTTVKIVLGFLELALAVKFLSNADLVKQWHLLPREVFIGIWILIGLFLVLFLAGIVRFGQPRPRFTGPRIFVIAFFALCTLYLVPGLTNTKHARLTFISGFPPPLCYSVYKQPVNCVNGVQPLENEYERALEIARQENKPVLIDFTGWACVNCRRMEESVWVDPEVMELMKNEFVVVSLYVDERKKLPVEEQFTYNSPVSGEKQITTVGDKWATFQSENFYAVAQPQYAIITPGEKALTKTKGYTPDAREFSSWLKCGLEAWQKQQQ